MYALHVIQIGVMGCSMGGAVALTLVGEDDSDVVGVVTVCVFTFSSPKTKKKSTTKNMC